MVFVTVVTDRFCTLLVKNRQLWFLCWDLHVSNVTAPCAPRATSSVENIQAGLHIPSGCNITEEPNGILFTTHRKRAGYKACYHGSLAAAGLPYWRIYRLIPKTCRISTAFRYKYYSWAIWRIFGVFWKHLDPNFFLVWRNILAHHFL